MTKKTLHGIPYEDVGGPEGLPEDERIRMIGNKATLGQVVGVLVEDDGDKVDRYVRKVAERFPTVELDYRGVYMRASPTVAHSSPYSGENPSDIYLLAMFTRTSAGTGAGATVHGGGFRHLWRELTSEFLDVTECGVRFQGKVIDWVPVEEITCETCQAAVAAELLVKSKVTG